MDRLSAALTGHLVDLSAYGNDVLRRMLTILSKADSNLVNALREALDRMPASEFKVARLGQLLTSVRRINAEAYETVSKQIELELRDLALYEAEFNVGLLRAVAATPEAALAISPVQVLAAVTEAPFRGRLLGDWVSGIGVRRMQRMQDAIAMGYVENKTIDQIVRAIKGTRASNYTDGIINMDRKDLTAVVRTAVAHYAQASREAVFRENTDIIERLEWSSTLDTRTSETCTIRDGLSYTPDDHEPIGHTLPWLGGPGRAHWNCRSSCVPRLKPTAMGEEFRSSQRASMDGPVSSKTTYATWLKRQSAARQDEVLGPSRGALMRKGKYTLDRFYNNEGRFLNLDELRKIDARTFKELGL